LRKAPSAELRFDQKDEDYLPPYEIVDKILYYLLEKFEGISQIISRGFHPDEVKKITRLVHQSEFKRKQAAPGLKITDRAFGTGWRMPIASVSLEDF
ncbi:MAG: NAD+ synthase, partial [Desulfovibrionales bacterium]